MTETEKFKILIKEIMNGIITITKNIGVGKIATDMKKTEMLIDIN
ncbi:MAG: hypothetical protein RMI30_00385 [Thermodesulfovibrio sp.]|nr:hypothetical protein [Thermodesulfovibrio sp.]MDW7997899.1 hypothetical protein [Thermodesulfovibrio sp.]